MMRPWHFPVFGHRPTSNPFPGPESPGDHQGDQKQAVDASPHESGESQERLRIAQVLEIKNRFCESVDLLESICSQMRGRSFEVAGARPKHVGRHGRKIYKEGRPGNPGSKRRLSNVDEGRKKGSAEHVLTDESKKDLYRVLRQYASGTRNIRTLYLAEDDGLSVLVVEMPETEESARKRMKKEIASRLQLKDRSPLALRFLGEAAPSNLEALGHEVSMVFDLAQEVDAYRRAAEYFEQHRGELRQQYGGGFVALISVGDDVVTIHGANRNELLKAAERTHPEYIDRVFVHTLSEISDSLRPIIE